MSLMIRRVAATIYVDVLRDTLYGNAVPPESSFLTRFLGADSEERSGRRLAGSSSRRTLARRDHPASAGTSSKLGMHRTEGSNIVG
jgi:hypothetical protein